VLVDFKTGAFAPSHVDEMRFYALLDTLRVGTPPRLVATYYLESGQPHPERVSVDLLEAAAARTIDGVVRLAELRRAPDDAVKRTGTACRWCPVLDSCAEGAAHLRGRLDDLDEPGDEDWA
jgi:hypothetical protein